MEPMMESVAVDDLEVNGKVDLSANLHALSSSSFQGSENIGNEPAVYGKLLLDDIDNYWDEINDRLTVSRMVSDSVIKGMVHAVVEESAEGIASKEAEIAILNEKLQLYDSRVATGIEFIKSPSEHGYFGATGDGGNLDSLKFAVEQQLHMLKEDIKNVTISSSHGRVNVTTDSILCNGLPKERTSEQLVEIDARVDTIGVVVSAVFEEIKGMFTSLKASMFEKKWECNFQREINSVIVQSCVTGLHAEFEKKLHEQRNLIHMLRMNWQQKTTELSTLREEFDSMSRSFLSSESSPLISYNSRESFEEWSTAKQDDQLPRTISGNSEFSSTIKTEENGSTTMKKTKDIAQPRLGVADTATLKHMSCEELATYYKTELLKMRRLHESALQEKTEEVFRFKRKFLKENGSPFRKDKDFELLKKKIPEVILKLDNILLEKETLPRIETNYDDICNLKDKINALLYDNQRLRGLLTEKEKEVRSLSSQISDVESQMSLHSLAETKYSAQIKELEESLEEMKTETDTSFELLNIIYKEVIGEYMFGREEIEVETRLLQDIYTTAIRGVIGDVMTSGHSIISRYFTEKSSLEALISEKQNLLSIETEESLEDMKTETDTSFELLNIIYKEVIGEYMFGREEIEVETRLLQDIYTTAIRGVIGDVMTSGHSIISRYFTEKSSLEALISEKQKLLSIETEESRKLKEAILSLSTLMKEKENVTSEADSTLMQEKQQFDLHNAELSMLKEQISKQQILISKNTMEFDLLQRTLDESQRQINQNESEISRLKKELIMASDALKEAEKQKTLLQSINEDKEKKYLSSITKVNQEAKRIHCIVASLMNLSEAFESKLTKTMEKYETRLKNLFHEFSSLFQWAHQLTKKEAWYKKMLDIRYSNLQKAEAEVDLLGDEVDALLGLLGKIYIALDHYSPVLQLYPGVMEVLKLVKRELEGERTHIA